MKKILLLLFLLPVLTTVAQTDTIVPVKNPKPSIATISTMDGRKVKGWFYRMDNDNVYLLNDRIKKPQLVDIKKTGSYNETVRINALQINKITLKKKNGGLKGALIGLGVGVIIGAIAGYAGGDDPVMAYTGTLNDLFAGFNNAFAMTAGQKAVAEGLLGGVTGPLTGAVIGALVKKKFIIGGKKDKYRDLHNDLMQRLIVQ